MVGAVTSMDLFLSSFSISINKIVALEGNTIEISSKRIPIGRNYLKQTKERILNINEEDKT